MSTIDNMILDQLDKQKITADQIANILDKVKNKKKEKELLNFLIDNSNTLLTDIEIYNYLKALL